jgi:hypothetical protein
MQNLLTLTYWFNLRPESLLPYAYKALVAGLIALAVLAIVTAFLKTKNSLYRGLFKRLYSFFLTNTLLGLLVLFFNYELVPFFSARFWIGLWILMMAVWLFFILKGLRAIPASKRQLEKEKELKKYIP